MMGLLKALALTGGEWVIYLLILCSILAVAIIIERSIFFSRERKKFVQIRNIFEETVQLKQYTTEKISSVDGYSAGIALSALKMVDHGISSIEEHISACSSLEKQKLETRMVVLGTLGNNAVYIGLFGTVLGVIKAFHDLAEQGSSGPEVVMKGLSEALLATAVGLLVAIPCVIAFNIFQKKIKDLVSDTESMIRLLLAQLKSEKK